MKRNDVLDQMNNIFADVLENEEINLQEITTAQDIDDWDSLNHIHIVVAIERHFSIRFSSKEIQSWKNVGEMIDSILEKTS